MRLIPTLALFLGAATSMVAQESIYGIPAEKTGEEAQAAYDAWMDETVPSWEYPAQMHFESHVGAEFADGEQSLNMEVGFQVEILHDSPEQVRCWGKGVLLIEGLGFGLHWRFEFQAVSNNEGLRMTLDDNRAFTEELNFHLPFAYTLTADRVEMLVHKFYEAVYSPLEELSEVSNEPLSQEHGTFGRYHPAIVARLVATYPTSQVVGWGRQGGQVLVQTMSDASLIKEVGLEEESEELQAFVDSFADTVYSVSLDEKTGSLIAYEFVESIPLDALSTPEMPFSGKMNFMMKLKRVPVSEDAPVVTFPECEKVLDCNVPFDKYWAILEMLLEVQQAQMEAADDEADSADDFDF